MYKTTVRFHSRRDLDLIEKVKADYYPTSLSKALCMALRDLYDLKADMAMIKKAIKPTLKIDPKVLQKIF